MPSGRPLASRLSQALVAFTVEIDNAFEARMIEAGYAGARLSLGAVVERDAVHGCGRHLCAGARRARVGRFVGLELRDRLPRAMAIRCGRAAAWRRAGQDPHSRAIGPRRPRRMGQRPRHSSGPDRPADADGQRAVSIWPPLIAEVEARWRDRFGDEKISALRRALATVIDGVEMELPEGFPAGWFLSDAAPCPPRAGRPAGAAPLAALLARVLLAFRVEFDRESPVPLSMCSTVLRAVGADSVRVEDLPRLTGVSSEAIGVGLSRGRSALFTVQPNPDARRGRIVRLTQAGLKAESVYHRILDEIEEGWRAKYGQQTMSELRQSLASLFERRPGSGPLIAEGLLPPPGVARAGVAVPALGRKAPAAAARQRMRDLAAQTRAFVENPEAALPHYPLWDFNRGFGP